MERWEEGFYITAMAGSAGGSSLVVMSKGTPYTQQSYKVGGLPCLFASSQRVETLFELEAHVPKDAGPALRYKSQAL